MGDRSLVERLIRAGADVNAADASGRTVLWWAKYSGSHDILVRLRKAGAQDLIKNQL
jgi:ankyrin repeat protein